LMSLTMPTMRLKAVFFAPSSRQAVPMQKRVDLCRGKARGARVSKSSEVTCRLAWGPLLVWG